MGCKRHPAAAGDFCWRFGLNGLHKPSERYTGVSRGPCNESCESGGVSDTFGKGRNNRRSVTEAIKLDSGRHEQAVRHNTC